MLRRPALEDRYRALAVAGEGVVLLSDAGEVVLRGPIYEHVIPLLDGRHTADDIVQHLAAEQPPAEVYYALGWLEARGHLTDGAGREPTPAAPTRLAAPDERRIALRTVGDVSATTCRDALAALGWIADAAAPVLLVATDSYLRPDLADINDAALAAEAVWLLARVAGPAPWIGPLFRPGATCCWRCLADRLRRNRPLEDLLLRPSTARTIRLPDAGPDALHAAIAALVAAPDEKLVGAITVLDGHGRPQRHEAVPRRRQCPACGDAGLHARRSGRHPTHAPQPAGVTPAELDTLVAPLTGVVHDVHLLTTDPDDPVHVAVARYGDGASRADVPVLDRELRGASGKGESPGAARASALAEAVERYCAAVQGDEPAVRATLAMLGESAIDPRACMQFSAAQYAEREARNRRAGRFQWIPRPFDPDEPLDWTRVWSLTHDVGRYLPTAMLYAGHPEAGVDASCVWDSSGSAAGESWAEAVLRGLLELVERDSLAIWWYNRLARPAVALEELDDPWLERFAAYARARGRELWALDLTTDLGMPCFAALAARTGPGPEAIVFGFGADLDARAALRRALAELGQVLVHVTDAQRAGRRLDPAFATWLREATRAEHPYLVPGTGTTTTLADPPRIATRRPAEDLRACVHQLSRHGLEPFVLDQTRPDVGVPVAKVVVPGLRHFRARFAPGRLYTVPPAMGWRPAPLPESALNPIAFFL